mgnify:CR=1 FL=1
MKKILFILFLIGTTTFVNAQTVLGIWESRNGSTNKVDSYVEVYQKDGKVYAKIIELTNKNGQDAVCSLCEGERKNKPILGMDILTGLKKNGKEWSGGTILDPRNGKEYKCYIKLESKNKLKIRGYIGISLFGRTSYWYRKI